MIIWYHVRDLDAARRFYALLGFEEQHVNETERWAELQRGEVRIALAEGEPADGGGVAAIDVADVKAEADRLRREGADVGVVFELHEEIRLLDVFDPDGNRIQLTQELQP
jgi:catechol 2,3-dioxygenase-like lactoylglutathione lyase family enzyme